MKRTKKDEPKPTPVETEAVAEALEIGKRFDVPIVLQVSPEEAARQAEFEERMLSAGWPAVETEIVKVHVDLEALRALKVPALTLSPCLVCGTRAPLESICPTCGWTVVAEGNCPSRSEVK